MRRTNQKKNDRHAAWDEMNHGVDASGTIYARAVLEQVIINFQTYSPGGATLFDLVSDDDMQVAAIGR